MTDREHQRATALDLAGAAPKYADLSPEKALTDAEELFTLWNWVIQRDTPRVGEFLPHLDTESGAEEWRKASLRIGVRFVLALDRAESLIESPGYRGWTPYLSSNFHDTSHAAGNVDSAVERRLLSEYLNGRWNCRMIEVLGSAGAGIAEDSYDLFIYWSIQHIAEVSTATNQIEHLRLGAVMNAHLGRRARHSSDKRDKKNFELRDAFFGSVVHTRDLHRLASRSDAVVARYGEKQVEVRLEQQLSLLFQSLGFYVAGTSRAERRVDLICIAPAHGGAPFSMLVEAKSSKGKYALPTKDSRALAEYVDHASALTTVPPLKVVLIVGPEPSGTIEEKLRMLEGGISIPVRYCEAGLLGSLRDALTGPVQPSLFLKHILGSSPVVDRSAILQICSADSNQRKLHTDFVRGLLGVITQAPPSPRSPGAASS
ncbi:hypothetical protein ABZ570_13975 [Micromonospora sp. NPDC007271]|uniref:hypothetical protein n=1 Tax=Micromonospora sp. NPDC007271 TaxID=3154587 RepID=UPI0033CB0BEE